MFVRPISVFNIADWPKKIRVHEQVLTPSGNSIKDLGISLIVYHFKCVNELVFRLPTGALIISMQSLAGESARDRRKRERREQYELRLAEW